MAIVDQVNVTLDLRLEDWQYPVPPFIISDLVELLRTEWTRSDFDWLEAMHGDYGRDLTISSVIARHGDRPVATASALFSRQNPEIALLGNVLTLREFRGRGIGGRVVEAAVELAAKAGCRICLLGTQAIDGNIYRRHGFDWHRGVVMRRQLNESAPLEAEYFRADRPTEIRAANWGDLPGLTFLAIQHLDTLLLDYPRGLVSGQSEQLDRCVSIFPMLMEDVRTHGGTLVVLAESGNGRVFGFATVTLGGRAAQLRTATIDVAVHDHYLDQGPALVQWLLDYCERQDVGSVQAWVAEVDAAKLGWLQQAGFKPLTKLRSALCVNGKTSDVILLDCSIRQRGVRVDATDERGVVLHPHHRSRPGLIAHSDGE